MFSNVFPHPYVDILRLFDKDASKLELSGDASAAIDKTIGKKVYAIKGITPAHNYVALPKGGPSSLGLGLAPRLPWPSRDGSCENRY